MLVSFPLFSDGLVFLSLLRLGSIKEVSIHVKELLGFLLGIFVFFCYFFDWWRKREEAK
jgi:hypothetical protein